MSTTIDVTLPNGQKDFWDMALNITDRWGEFNMHDLQSKRVAIGELLKNQELHEALLGQMCGEETFIVQKDGEFGILYEVEYTCKESENDDSLPPYEDVKGHLLKGLQAIASEFEGAGICFCVPPEHEVHKYRPAVWAFVKKDALDEAARERLWDRLMSL